MDFFVERSCNVQLISSTLIVYDGPLKIKAYNHFRCAGITFVEHCRFPLGFKWRIQYEMTSSLFTVNMYYEQHAPYSYRQRFHYVSHHSSAVCHNVHS